MSARSAGEAWVTGAGKQICKRFQAYVLRDNLGNKRQLHRPS
jgi:hypothetical protein